MSKKNRMRRKDLRRFYRKAYGVNKRGLRRMMRYSRRHRRIF